MSLTEQPAVQLRHLDRFFIGGEWVAPSSEATITVPDSATEERFFSVAEAQAADVSRAVEAGRQAFARWRPRCVTAVRRSATSGLVIPACCTESRSTLPRVRPKILSTTPRSRT